MEAVMFAVLISSMFGYCIFLIYVKFCEPSQAPLYTFCIIGITASLGAIFKILLPVTYFLYGLGIALLLLTLVLSVVKKKFVPLIKTLLDPGLIIFYVLFVIFFALCRPVLSYSFDEFTHWALEPQYMIMYDKIPVNGDIVNFFTYPPFTAAIKYYFARFLKYQEGMLYFGQIMLLISAAVSGMSIVKKKWSFKGLLLFALGYIVMLKYCGFDFYNLYSDVVMAMLAAAAFIIYLGSEKDYKSILKISPILFAATWVRESSLIFSVFTILLIIADQIITHGKKLITWEHKGFISKNKNILSVVALSAAVLLSVLIWNGFLGIVQAGNAYTMKAENVQFNMQFKEVVLYAIKYFGQFSYTSIGSYTGALKMFSMLPVVFVTEGLILGTLYLLLEYKKRHDLKKRLAAFGIVVFVIWALYTFGLMFSYLNRFVPNEADEFAALDRYLSSLVVYTLVIVIYFTSYISENIVSKMAKKITSFMLAIVFAVLFISTTPERIDLYANRIISYNGIRYTMHEKLSRYHGRFTEDEKVFVVAQGYGEAITQHIFKYELMANTNTYFYHMFEGDRYLDLSPEVFEKYVLENGFDYLIVVSTDEFYVNKYSGMFDKLSDETRLYKITPGGEHLFTSID